MEIKARATGLTDVQQLIGAEKFGSDAICDILDADCGMSEESKAVLNSYLKVTQDMREALEELSNTHTSELSNTHVQKEADGHTRSEAEIGSELAQEDVKVPGKWGVLVKVKGYTMRFSDADTKEEAVADVEDRLDKFEDTRELLDSLKPSDIDWKVVSANTR